jgi:hypothetical protein
VNRAGRGPRRREATEGIALLAAGALACALLAACATAAAPGPTLTWEMQTLRMPLHIDGNGTASLAAFPPLTGRLDLSPILAAEKVPAGQPVPAQVMLHYGRLYLAADGFRSVWEITPSPGTASAAYRPIPISRGPSKERLKDVRLSRYGSSEASCLRLDRAGGRPVFITPKGEARDECP